MPTPKGLLRKGDRIRHKESGLICTVVKREGNELSYSVILRPDRWPPHTKEAYGYSRCFRLLEAGYWIRHTYEVLP